MNTKSNENVAEQRAVPNDIFWTPEAQRLVTEIRSQLPGLAALNGAFADLHQLLAEADHVADFDTWCRHDFGVVPELLLEATDRLQVHLNSTLES